MATVHDIQIQLARLHNTGFLDKLSQQAAANGFAPSFFFAIASRETNCVNELIPVVWSGPAVEVKFGPPSE